MCRFQLKTGTFYFHPIKMIYSGTRIKLKAIVFKKHPFRWGVELNSSLSVNNARTTPPSFSLSPLWNHCLLILASSSSRCPFPFSSSTHPHRPAPLHWCSGLTCPALPLPTSAREYKYCRYKYYFKLIKNMSFMKCVSVTHPRFAIRNIYLNIRKFKRFVKFTMRVDRVTD